MDNKPKIGLLFGMATLVAASIFVGPLSTIAAFATPDNQNQTSVSVTVEDEPKPATPGHVQDQDLDCVDYSAKNFTIEADNDPYGIDGDNDGIACEYSNGQPVPEDAVEEASEQMPANETSRIPQSVFNDVIAEIDQALVAYEEGRQDVYTHVENARDLLVAAIIAAEQPAGGQVIEGQPPADVASPENPEILTNETNVIVCVTDPCEPTSAGNATTQDCQTNFDINTCPLGPGTEQPPTAVNQTEEMPANETLAAGSNDTVVDIPTPEEVGVPPETPVGTVEGNSIFVEALNLQATGVMADCPCVLSALLKAGIIFYIGHLVQNAETPEEAQAILNNSDTIAQEVKENPEIVGDVVGPIVENADELSNNQTTIETIVENEVGPALEEDGLDTVTVTDAGDVTIESTT